MTNHSTFVDIAGRLVLANEDDPHYEQVFADYASYFELIQRLINDGNEHFGTYYQMGVNNGFMNVDYTDGVHASDFAKPTYN